jgi:hypothetical protein
MNFEAMIQLMCASSPLIIGITLVFFRNAWWRWQVSQSEQRGWEISERSTYWDIMMIAVGVLFLIIGALLMLIVLFPQPRGIIIGGLF